MGQMGETDTCALRFDADFPHFAQVDVNGSNVHPLFKFLKEGIKGTSWLFGSAVTWNFEKFLVDRDGIPVSRYGKTDDYGKLEKDLVALLDKPASS
jgi:glutathione peroxidase